MMDFTASWNTLSQGIVFPSRKYILKIAEPELYNRVPSQFMAKGVKSVSFTLDSKKDGEGEGRDGGPQLGMVCPLMAALFHTTVSVMP